MKFLDKLKELYDNKYTVIALVCFITLFALFLRLIAIDKPEGLWFDEIYSRYIAEEAFPSDLLQKLNAKDTHMPLYYFFLHFWMRVFGDADVVLRLLSVFFGTLTIPFMYLAGKELSDKKTGLIAALLAATNSLLIYYSQEVRFYSLLMLVSSIVALYLIKVLKNHNNRDLIYLTLANITLIYTYTIGFVFVFFEVLVAGFYLFKENIQYFKHFIKSQLVTATVFIITVPFMQNLYSLFMIAFDKSINISSTPAFELSHIAFVIHSFFSPVLASIFASDHNYLQFIIQHGVISLFFIVAFMPVLLSCFLIYKTIKNDTVSKMLLIVILVFFIVQIVFAITGKLNLISRYSILLLPFLLVLVAKGINYFNKKHFSAFLLVFLVLINVSYLILNNHSAPKLQRLNPFKPTKKVLDLYGLTKKDLVIMPFGHQCLYYYYDKTQISDFDIFNTRNLKEKKYYDFADVINKVNKDDLLTAFLKSNKIQNNFMYYIDNSILDKVQKGHYIIFIIYSGLIKNNLSNKQIRVLLQTNPELLKSNPFIFVRSKVLNDMLNLIQENSELLVKKQYNGYYFIVFKKV